MRTSENRQNGLQRQLQRLTEPDGALLSKMEAYSAALLQHSVEISHLSENAAKQIGADAALACAGGLYHELGRIAGTEDYIQAGVQLGQENEFPEALLDVIRQHSTGHDLPKSPEAAVVMLSDCIVSTQEYLKKTGKLAEISPKRLIEGIFQNRIKKGNLAHAGLTAEQLDDLQEFYIQQALAKTQ